MSRIALWVVLVLLLVGGGYYFYSRSSTRPAAQPGSTYTQSADENSDGQFEGTIGDLVNRGGNYKCEWSFSDKGTTMSGVTYVSGKKLSGEATAKTTSGDLITHMVGDGTTVYSWVEVAGFKSGTKFSYDELNSYKPTAEEKQASDQYFQKTGYKCSAWTPEASKFVVPTDVTFTN